MITPSSADSKIDEGLVLEGSIKHSMFLGLIKDYKRDWGPTIIFKPAQSEDVSGRGFGYRVWHEDARNIQEHVIYRPHK